MKIRNRYLFVFLFSLAFFLPVCSRAQDSEWSPGNPAVAAPSAESLDAACAKFGDRFKLLLSWLATPKSAAQDDHEREQALKLIDEPFLYPDALKLPCVGEFFRARMNVFMKNFESAKVDNGVVVWKLYNHGVIIQTKDIRIAVDLISGYDQVKWDDALLQRLVDRVDALLVTHSHADHVDHQVLDMFVKAGKPIVVPEIFWSDYYHNDKLTVMREGELKFEGVTVRVFPSFQSPSLQKEVVDNVYLITTKEGYKIMHLGDENEVFRAGPAWYSKIKKPVDIDILIPNIWSPNLATILKVVKPKLVISSHEHELSHAVSGRRTYDYVYKILRTIKVPYAVPVWGESVRWPPVQGAPAAN